MVCLFADEAPGIHVKVVSPGIGLGYSLILNEKRIS
jgi:hypothetical protein